LRIQWNNVIILGMRPKGSAAELEARRRRAASLLAQGLGLREVARQVGSSPSSVKRWKEMKQAGGSAALAAKPHPGRPPRLSAKQKQKLVQLLLKGATAHGYAGELWTLPRVAELIERRFGVCYHPAHVWKLLHGLGWSAQKPQRRARERDEAEIERWRRERWPHIKKGTPAGLQHRLPG
jgi:transposase